MTREISRWGVGPSIMLSAGGYAAVAGIATWLWPKVFIVSVIPYTAFVASGIMILVVGLPMLIVGGRAAMRAYDSDELATTGIFGLVRNPIYSAWIVFLIPGLVLLSRSWPMFLTPLVAYVVFKARIGREDEYLENRFGEGYRQYRTQVNELIPISRRKPIHQRQQ